MATEQQFLALLDKNGSSVIYNRPSDGTPCPCRTPEGYRDPIWHIQHPNSAMCNEGGWLPDANDIQITVKAFFQPIQSTRATRLRSQYVMEDFGEVETGDHLGIFPLDWQGVSLNFYDWPSGGEAWVSYDSRRYTVVHSNKISDPDGGLPHHWEVGVRLISSEDL